MLLQRGGIPAARATASWMVRMTGRPTRTMREESHPQTSPMGRGPTVRFVGHRHDPEERALAGAICPNEREAVDLPAPRMRRHRRSGYRHGRVECWPPGIDEHGSNPLIAHQYNDHLCYHAELDSHSRFPRPPCPAIRTGIGSSDVATATLHVVRAGPTRDTGNSILLELSSLPRPALAGFCCPVPISLAPNVRCACHGRALQPARGWHPLRRLRRRSNSGRRSPSPSAPARRPSACSTNPVMLSMSPTSTSIRSTRSRACHGLEYRLRHLHRALVDQLAKPTATPSTAPSPSVSVAPVALQHATVEGETPRYWAVATRWLTFLAAAFAHHRLPLARFVLDGDE